MMVAGNMEAILDYMKDISNYWVKDFDWRKHEAEINKFSNFTTRSRWH